MKNRKAFTLIELLAVIIILGVLLLIAIPSVTEYILNSRKEAYVKNISGYLDGIKNKVNSAEYAFFDDNTTYYVHINNIKLERGGQSPFGDWVDAYAVVTYTGDGFEYYWTSVDSSGYKIALKKREEIKIDDVKSGDDLTVNNRQRIGNREKIYIIDKNGNIIETSPILILTKEEARECFVYSVVNDKAIIDSYDVNCSKDVEIPAFIDGYPVTEIGSYAFNGLKINSVIIPEGIIKIGGSSFRGNNLTKISFPQSLTSIGNEAFANNKLTSISFPGPIASLGTGAFTNNLIPEESAMIYKQNSNGTVDYSMIIGYAGASKDIVIPASVEGVALKTIAASSFRNLQLNSVVIPSTVETIGTFAFGGNRLTSVVLPSSLKTIEGAAFAGNRLASLNIPPSVTSIATRSFNVNLLPDEEAFIYARNSDGTTNYSNIVSYAGANRGFVTIPATKNGVALKTIGSSAFMSVGITGVSIPASVTSIGTRAFSSNKLPDEQAFIYRRTASGIDYSTIIGYGGIKKENIIVPSHQNGVALTTIASNAFTETGLKSLILPETLTTIASSAFTTSYLTQITIPKNVTSIGSNAFLKTVSFGRFNMITNIVNETGRSFDWRAITGGTESATFVTGIVPHKFGDIEVTSE